MIKQGLVGVGGGGGGGGFLENRHAIKNVANSAPYLCNGASESLYFWVVATAQRSECEQMPRIKTFHFDFAYSVAESKVGPFLYSVRIWVCSHTTTCTFSPDLGKCTL